MPILLFAGAAALGLVAVMRRRHLSQGTPPSNPRPGQTYSYVGPDGVQRTAQWNGAAWVLVA